MTCQSSSVMLQALILTAISALQLFCVSLSAFAGTNEWTPLGPERGRVALLTMDPTNPQILYASGENGGFKTTNGGASWTPIAYIHLQTPTALALDPNNPQVLYQTFAAQCGRVFKSNDGGASILLPVLNFGPIILKEVCPQSSMIGFVVDPSDSRTLYAAGSVEGGIFKSTDSGKTWTKMSSGLIGAPSFLVIDLRNPQTLYTGTFSVTEARGRIFKTMDGGASWTTIDNGITRPLTTSPFALVIDPTNSQTLYVASYGGIFKSTDGGMRWENLEVGLPTVFVAALAIDPKNPQVLYAAANGGVLKSSNGGGTWIQDGAGLPITPWALAIDFQDPQVLYAGVYDEAGVYKSTDGGKRWVAMNAGLTDVTISGVVTDPRDSQTVYITASPGGVSKSTEGGRKFASMNTGLPNPPVNLTIDPKDPQVLYAVVPLLRQGVRANFPSAGIFKTTNGGRDWTSINEGLDPDSGSSIDLPDVFAKVVIDPQNSQTLYVADILTGLYQSINGGEDWESINENLRRALTVVIDPTNSQTLYAGLHSLSPLPGTLGRGGVVKSTNGGGDWISINQGFPANPSGAFPPIPALVIDPSNPQIVYAAVGGVQSPGLYKSTNGGESWRKGNGIPLQFGVHCIAMDPQNSQILYAGTNAILSADPGGVYKSIDGGETWAPLNNGFPRTGGIGLGVFSLAIDYQNPNTLYAGTLKYGLFVLTQQ